MWNREDQIEGNVSSNVNCLTQNHRFKSDKTQTKHVNKGTDALGHKRFVLLHQKKNDNK